MNTFESRIAVLEGLRKAELATHRRAKDEVDNLDRRISEHEGAILLCKRCMDDQADLKGLIENVVTSLLRAIFGEQMAFHLEPVVENDTLVGLKPMIEGDDGVLPPKQHGAGARSLASFGIRMVFNAFLSKRLGTAPFQFYDEHLLHLDADKWPKLTQFIEDFQKQVPFQFAFISHVPMEFPYTIEVYKSGKISRVRAIEGYAG